MCAAATAAADDDDGDANAYETDGISVRFSLLGPRLSAVVVLLLIYLLAVVPESIWHIVFLHLCVCFVRWSHGCRATWGGRRFRPGSTLSAPAAHREIHGRRE